MWGFFLPVGISVVDVEHRRRPEVFFGYKVAFHIPQQSHEDGKLTSDNRPYCCCSVCQVAHSNDHRSCTYVNKFGDSRLFRAESRVFSRNSIATISLDLPEPYGQELFGHRYMSLESPDRVGNILFLRIIHSIDFDATFDALVVLASGSKLCYDWNTHYVTYFLAVTVHGQMVPTFSPV